MRKQPKTLLPKIIFSSPLIPYYIRKIHISGKFRQKKVCGERLCRRAIGFLRTSVYKKTASRQHFLLPKDGFS